MDNNGRTCVVRRRAVLETTMIVRVNDALIILLQWVYVCMAIHLQFLLLFQCFFVIVGHDMIQLKGIISTIWYFVGFDAKEYINYISIVISMQG